MENKEAAFCIECGEKRPYRVSSSRDTIMVKGITFSYIEMQAFCTECGAPVYVPEINDANVEAREEGYRKAAKLITVAEVNELLEKYNIGAGPLAKLLGFGDVTINRYISGQLPSRDHSDLLLKIKASHRLMEEYLEKGRSGITSIAYEKCRAAIDEINCLYGSEKIERVARYLLCKAGEITPLALQKLLYFTQAFYYAIFDEEFFPDDCQAWSYGPVYPEIYYKYKGYGSDPIDKPTDDLQEDFCEFTTREVSLMDAIIDSFGRYSALVLRDITHSERPWLEARGSLLPEDRSQTVINRDTINRYFRSVVDKYQIVNPRDIALYCNEMVQRI